MRLDKYLKVAHLIKRRGLAKTYIEAGYAYVNNRPAKPSTQIKVGDRIALGDPSKPRLEVEVLELKDYCPVTRIKEMYQVIGQNGYLVHHAEVTD